MAADASRTTVEVGAGSDIVGGTRLVAVTIKAYGRDRVRCVRNAISDPVTNCLEPVNCGERSCATRLDVVLQAMAIFHGHEHGQRPMVAFDDEALSSRGLIENAAERLPEIERGDDSHGRP